jgi:hypothetical protein
MTVFVPFGNVDPLAGVQITARFVPQSSVAVATNVTLLFEHSPPSVFTTMFDGQLIVGGAVWRTTMVNVQLGPLAVEHGDRVRARPGRMSLTAERMSPRRNRPL